MLLKEFNNYWTPVDNPNNDATTASRGSVTDAGVAILGKNDELTVAINNKADVDSLAGVKADDHYTQQQRAVIDAAQDNRETYWDAFGPIIGEWFYEGYQQDASGNVPLSKTGKLLNDMVDYIPVTGAKHGFNYPRPSLNTAEGDAIDRSANGENDLKGLAPALALKRAPGFHDDFRNVDRGNGYGGLVASESFPSGHTMAFYTSGLTLAAMMPEFAPQITARAAEGGNNRIVLGVHYPLDVIGGRIVGEASAAGRLNDDVFYKQVFKPAQQELRDYLTKRGQEAGYGNTLDEIIANTKANTTNGYKDLDTDSVATEQVTDVKSAVNVYTQRLTYGFAPVSDTTQPARVPAGAEALLRTVFPTLNADQRREVLARTEIKSGYPLDSTSDGWQRLNLAAAFSSKVTIDDKGNVVSVEPGQQAQVVVKQTTPNGGNNNSAGNNNANGNNSDNGANGGAATEPGNGNHKATATNGKLSDTGADANGLAVMTMLFLAAGAMLTAANRMRRR
ncbi:phosphatase PAP2 family protein [Bifidobacterium aesculapii]|uniref:phosphatase PAP2 family protein n=1 Tax=Bifidobacterium aesculapii TaxID=1329411 RepID=UPI0006E1C0F5|nr:phosphatase PAP2 family protein [Bifidobacterium aesculapii]